MSQTLLDQRVLGVGTALTDHTITATDVISFADVGASNVIKRDTVQGVLDLAGGAGLTLLETDSPSASATVDVTGFNNSTYDEYLVTFSLYKSASGTLKIVVSTDGGSSWITSGYYYAANGYLSSGSEDRTYGANTSEINLYNDLVSNAATTSGGWMHITEAGSGTYHTRFKWQMVGKTSAGTWITIDGAGGPDGTAADTDAIQFGVDSGNLTGKIRLFGITKT